MHYDVKNKKDFRSIKINNGIVKKLQGRIEYPRKLERTQAEIKVFLNFYSQKKVTPQN